MKMPISLIADRYTILKVRSENGIDCTEEFKRYERAVKDNIINKKFLKKLYKINKKMWPLHDWIVNSKNNKEIAKLSLKLLKLNNQRSIVRSKIAEQFKEFTEYKTYD